MQKENGDLRASLREVERSRLEARRELQELRRQVVTTLLDNCNFFTRNARHSWHIFYYTSFNFQL